MPDQQLNADSRDLIKLVMGLIATVAALVLGLLISSAHRSYDAQEAEVQQLGVHLFQLDRALERFGHDAGDARNLLRRIVSAEIEYASTQGGTGVATDKPLQAQKEAAELFDRVANLSPKTDAQRFMQSQALHLLAGLADTRLLLNEQARGSISWPFLVVLVFRLTVLFVGFGLFARLNPRPFLGSQGRRRYRRTGPGAELGRGRARRESAAFDLAQRLAPASRVACTVRPAAC